MKNINTFRLPNLYIPGSGKSGTSTLHELLNEHPDICMSSEKEPHFWTNSNFENYTDEDFKKYCALFINENVSYFGESSTGYFCFPEFITRIKKNYKDSPKFIIILRNPVDRIYSHYWWLKGLGSERKTFRDAVLNDFNMEPNDCNRLREGNFKSYFQFGLYGKWMTKFINEFSSQNIHIITTENLRTDTLNTINGCFKFLELEPLETIPEINNNKTIIFRHPELYKHTKKLVFSQNVLRNTIKIFIPKKFRQRIRYKIHQTVFDLTATNQSYPTITIEEREWLKTLYEQDVQLLKEITGLEFSEWIDFN